MFLKKMTTNSTQESLICEFKKNLDEFDNVVIGAGAGLSISAGLEYGGERFKKYFPDFMEKYGFYDMYSGAFQKFDDINEYWAYFSRHIYYNRYDFQPNDTYQNLLKLVSNKNYFVITTNADGLFLKSKFDKKRIFYTQGDYSLWQCSKPCHNDTYNNEKTVLEMINTQKNMKVSDDLIPYCSKCGEKMTMNLRMDNKFVEPEGWNEAKQRYQNFLENNQKVLFLEFGIGANNPSIIKYPFWQMTYNREKSFYVCVNLGEAVIPNEIKGKSLGFDMDIREFLHKTNL